MTLVLLAVGLLASAVGLVTIGFGIPINAFSLGDTLIISGTIAVSSGLILIGLASVLGQLKRIAAALRSAPRLTESVEAAPPPPARAKPAAALAPELNVPEPPRMMPEPPRAPEPRFSATAAEPAAAGSLDWLRAKSKPVTVPAAPAVVPPAMTEPPMVEVPDEAPLSPRSPQRPAMPPVVELAPELAPKVWSPSREVGPLESRPAPRAEPPMTRVAPQVEPPKEKERFFLVWPDGGALAPAPTSSSAPAAESKVEIRREPALDMPLPPIPARPRDNRPAAEKRMPNIIRKVAAERGPAILKSGVIDGMPYTLYADGSIEAQLPQGTVKFASVDALRAHLEKSG